MIIPKEIMPFISILNNGMIWIYTAIFFICMYLLISLLTWSFIKPLKYLGIPTCIIGILFIIFRLFSNTIFVVIGLNSNLIKAVVPTVLRPLLFNGIFCLVLSILMIVLYVIINNIRSKNKNINIIKS